MELEKVVDDKKVDDKKRLDNIIYCREWYRKNKDRHFKYITEMIVCSCGKQLQRCHLRRHEKTKLHARLLQQK